MSATEPEHASVIDPVCAFHGKRQSEHEHGRCLYCCLCFATLAPDDCWVDERGQAWDLCSECGDLERPAGKSP